MLCMRFNNLYLSRVAFYCYLSVGNLFMWSTVNPVYLLFILWLQVFTKLCFTIVGSLCCLLASMEKFKRETLIWKQRVCKILFASDDCVPNSTVSYQVFKSWISLIDLDMCLKPLSFVLRSGHHLMCYVYYFI